MYNVGEYKRSLSMFIYCVREKKGRKLLNYYHPFTAGYKFDTGSYTLLNNTVNEFMVVGVHFFFLPFAIAYRGSRVGFGSV